jgi:hypothetical protein
VIKILIDYFVKVKTVSTGQIQWIAVENGLIAPPWLKNDIIKSSKNNNGDHPLGKEETVSPPSSSSSSFLLSDDQKKTKVCSSRSVSQSSVVPAINNINMYSSSIYTSHLPLPPPPPSNQSSDSSHYPLNFPSDLLNKSSAIQGQFRYPGMHTSLSLFSLPPGAVLPVHSHPNHHSPPHLPFPPPRYHPSSHYQYSVPGQSNNSNEKQFVRNVPTTTPTNPNPNYSSNPNNPLALSYQQLLLLRPPSMVPLLPPRSHSHSHSHSSSPPRSLHPVVMVNHSHHNNNHITGVATSSSSTTSATPSSSSSSLQPSLVFLPVSVPMNPSTASSSSSSSSSRHPHLSPGITMRGGGGGVVHHSLPLSSASSVPQLMVSQSNPYAFAAVANNSLGGGQIVTHSRPLMQQIASHHQNSGNINSNINNNPASSSSSSSGHNPLSVPVGALPLPIPPGQTFLVPTLVHNPARSLPRPPLPPTMIKETFRILPGGKMKKNHEN